MVNTTIINWDKFKNYNKTESRKYLRARYYIPEPIIEQLKEVREHLLKEVHYADLTKQLPEIKERE